MVVASGGLIFGLEFMVVVGGWVMVAGDDCGFVGFTVVCFCF